MDIRVVRRLTAVVVFVASLACGGHVNSAATADPPIDLTRLDDRTRWHRVNAKPYPISSVLNILCDAPGPSRIAEERERNPHASTAVTVYVNDVARAAMFAKTPTTFPTGSVIVKQKVDQYDEPDKPLLSTVMIKRERGYNSAVGDWEFAVVGPDGTEIRARGKLENCAACHTPRKATDFVFRGYVHR